MPDQAAHARHLQTGSPPREETGIFSDMDVLILIRLASELTLKSPRTRSGFTRRLMQNIHDCLNSAGIAHRTKVEWGRAYVKADSPAAVAALTRVFGISSVSQVDAVVPPELDAIVQRGTDLFRDQVAGKRFAVRARRAGEHSFRSKDVEMRLGAALLPSASRVDLTHPEVIANVEIRPRQAYLFSTRAEAFGGLPLGVEGRALALLSGGYDSAVASWLLLKRGVEQDYVFCNLGGEAYERAVVQVAKVLADEWSFGTRPKLHVVDFGAPLDELRAKVRQNYWQVVLKRLMYRAASRIGHGIRAQAIITGEAIGQVSSQTLSNLTAIEPATDLPVFRPLVGFDKEEIIARARTIGTAALSEQVKEYCAIAPGRPVTGTTAEKAAAEEAKMDPSILDLAIAGTRTLDLRTLTPTDLAAPYLFTTTIPDDAVVIDCRPEPQYQAWHAPGAVHRDEWELLRDFRRLDRNRTYILYCAMGMQTAYLAEKMQNAGYEAYSFRGGARELRKRG